VSDPEDHDLNLHGRENLEPRSSKYFLTTNGTIQLEIIQNYLLRHLWTVTSVTIRMRGIWTGFILIRGKRDRILVTQEEKIEIQKMQVIS
jgi:hypothetical protein